MITQKKVRVQPQTSKNKLIILDQSLKIGWIKLRVDIERPEIDLNQTINRYNVVVNKGAHG